MTNIYDDHLPDVRDHLVKNHNMRKRGSPFQVRVLPWLTACFGEDVRKNTEKRSARFIEEAVELVQACGFSKAKVLEIVDRVFDRTPGERRQEIGGVMVTLAALSIAHEEDMVIEGERELERIWTKMPKIRVKETTKPFANALPDHIDTQAGRDEIDAS